MPERLSREPIPFQHLKSVDDFVHEINIKHPEWIGSQKNFDRLRIREKEFAHLYSNFIYKTQSWAKNECPENIDQQQRKVKEYKSTLEATLFPNEQTIVQSEKQKKQTDGRYKYLHIHCLQDFLDDIKINHSVWSNIESLQKGFSLPGFRAYYQTFNIMIKKWAIAKYPKEEQKIQRREYILESRKQFENTVLG